MELRRWLVSEIMAPTLTLSAFCDTKFGSRIPKPGDSFEELQNLPISQFEVTIGVHSQCRQSALLPRSFPLHAFRESVETSASGL